MAGVLKVSGMGKFLFPAEPRTIVRTRSLPRHCAVVEKLCWESILEFDVQT